MIFKIAIVFFIALPWVNPFAPGPSPAVIPWLFSLAAACGLAWVGVARRSASTLEDWLQSAAWAFFAAGLLSSAMGLLQYFGQAALFAPWVNQTGPGEAFANLRQRNQFASLTNMALAALLFCLLALQSELGLTKGRMAFAVSAAVLLMLGCAASSSRTGMAQLLMLCVLAGLWGLWRQIAVRWVLIAAVFAYAVATFALPWLAGLDPSVHGMAARLRQGDTVCGSRLILWSNVLHLIAQKPLMGWGWGELDYAHFITLYEGERFCDILDNAHNLPLHLAVELGVPFALLVCGGFAAWVFWQRPWSERQPARQLAWGVLAIILLHSLLEYPLWYGPFQIAFALCMGVLLSRPGHEMALENAEPSKDRAFERKVPAAPYLYAAAATLLIAFCGYAGWDYRRISQVYLEPDLRAAAYRDDTLAQAQKSWLFSSQVKFAELLLTPLQPSTAQKTFDLALKLLHYSPEARVVEKLIESAVMLGRDGEALFYLARYRAAFPAEHAIWAATSAKAVAAPVR